MEAVGGRGKSMLRPSNGKEFGLFQKWEERFVGLDSQGDPPP